MAEGGPAGYHSSASAEVSRPCIGPAHPQLCVVPKWLFQKGGRPGKGLYDVASSLEWAPARLPLSRVPDHFHCAQQDVVDTRQAAHLQSCRFSRAEVEDTGSGTVRFGSATRVLAKHMLKDYRISW